MRFVLKDGNDIAVGPKPCGANANYTNLSNFIRIDFYYFVKLVSLAKFALKNYQGQQLYDCLKNLLLSRGVFLAVKALQQLWKRVGLKRAPAVIFH